MKRGCLRRLMSMSPRDELLRRVDGLYDDWLVAVGGEPRMGQRHMLRVIAESFLLGADGERLAVVEAGTGTGKTIAYLLAGTLCAQALEKKLVIATSTVMLQDQVVRELLRLVSHTSLDVRAGVVKGRGRYLCPLKLQQKQAMAQGELILESNQSATAPRLEGELAEDEDDEGADSEAARAVLASLAEAWHAGEWDGDRDHWIGVMPGSLWRELTNSRVGCLRERCAHFNNCPFFLARDETRQFDLLVTNQDLLLADLLLGGGVILPAPEDSIIIIDEAHNLAGKARRWASCAADPGTFEGLGRDAGKTMGSAWRLLGDDEAFQASADRYEERLRLLKSPQDQLVRVLSSLEFTSDNKDAGLCYFPRGELPAQMLELGEELSAHLQVMAQETSKCADAVEQAIDDSAADDQRPAFEALLIELREQASKLFEQGGVMLDFAPPPDQVDAQQAIHSEARVRWSVCDKEGAVKGNFGLRSAPLFPGNRLETILWSRCYAALCTSATLRGLGSFESFKLDTGIGERAVFEYIESPFPYRDMVTMRVPAEVASPRTGKPHTNDVVRLLPKLLLEEKTGLILFTSWRQLLEVYHRLPARSRKLVLSQGAMGSKQLIGEHMRAVDAGKRSYLMGVASLTEGLDLPDEYCRHVIIAKLPFMVPTDPVERALSEWYEENFDNAFRALSLPYASLKLRQACGRLVRNENDYGRITLLDSRAANTSWGREILDSLPPYRLTLT